MSKNVQEFTIMDRVGILTAAFTAAVTDIITSNAHGLKNGDKVVLTTTDTLPAGLATATVYWVRDVTTNTFKLSATSNTGGLGPIVNVTDTGTGTHTFTMHDIGNATFVKGFQHLLAHLNTAGNANLTVKFQSSGSEDCPDFSAAQANDNRWDYIDAYDQEDKASIDGDTGVAPAGTDDHRHFKINTDGITWLNAIISGWSAGNVTIKGTKTEN